MSDPDYNLPSWDFDVLQNKVYHFEVFLVVHVGFDVKGGFGGGRGWNEVVFLGGVLGMFSGSCVWRSAKGFNCIFPSSSVLLNQLLVVFVVYRQFWDFWHRQGRVRSDRYRIGLHQPLLTGDTNEMTELKKTTMVPWPTSKTTPSTPSARTNNPSSWLYTMHGLYLTI